MAACGIDLSHIKEERLYTVQEAAMLLGASTQTVQTYRRHGVVSPLIRGRSPFFTENDIRWLRCVRELIHVNKISIEALKKLIEYAPCWEIKNCPEDQRALCIRLKDSHLPHLLKVVPAGNVPGEISTQSAALPSPGKDQLDMNGRQMRCRFAKQNDMSGDTLKT